MVLMNLLELQQKLLSDLLCFFFQFFMKTNRHCCSLKPCRNLHWNLNKRITKKSFNCSCMHISHTLRDDTHMTLPPSLPPSTPTLKRTPLLLPSTAPPSRACEPMKSKQKQNQVMPHSNWPRVLLFDLADKQCNGIIKEPLHCQLASNSFARVNRKIPCQ